MPIKILQDSISFDNIQKILAYYNEHKHVDNEPLEHLDRYEGGFKINITKMKDIKCDDNKKIKQLRWHNRFLLNFNYIGFDIEENNLLYNSLAAVLGQENVDYH
jgi:hypothetical protein